MQHHPVAADLAALVAGRDPQRLAAALTETARLRALLPGGPIQAHGRDDVAACFHGFFADFDTVQLVESAGEAVADRLLIHYRLHVTRARTAGCAPRPRSASSSTGAWLSSTCCAPASGRFSDEHVAA